MTPEEMAAAMEAMAARVAACEEAIGALTDALEASGGDVSSVPVVGAEPSDE